MSDFFTSVQHSFALLLGTSDALAGIVLSMITIAAFAVTFIVAFAIAKVQVNFYAILFAFGLGLAFCTAVLWLPPWVAILVVIVPVFTWAMKGRGSDE